MMRLMLLILLISANCMKMKCDEEPAIETPLEVSEKTELLPEDSESLQSKAENNENKNEASKTSEDGEEIRVSRSSANLFIKNKTQFDESYEVYSTEISLAEKSAPGEVISEIGRQANEESAESKTGSNSPEALQNDTKSAEYVEKQLEEMPETSKSTPITEDRNAEDLLEASAENKLSDIENASSKVDETDRNSETEEIKETSDESGLNENLETRRMFLDPDNIVIDTKTRADTTSDVVEPEVKTALNQNLNTYNNFNEFGSNSNIKLTDSSQTEPSPTTVKTTIPIVTKLAPQEIFNQQYFPKFYPRPELNINFPNVNSDFQGPRDLPVYLKIKQDELQPKIQYIDEQNSQIKTGEENTYFNPRNQQQFHQSQRMVEIPGTLTNKPHEDFRSETRNQMPRFYHNQVPAGFESFIENKRLANLHQNSRNQVQQIYHKQENINLDYKRPENLNSEPKNREMKNINEQGNQYPLFRQPQGMLDSKINLGNQVFGTERFANPYYHLQSPNPQQVLNAPRYNHNIIPNKIKILFQKLASASEFARKIPTFFYNNNNIQNYQHFINPHYRADSSFHDHGYMPAKRIMARFQRLI